MLGLFAVLLQVLQLLVKANDFKFDIYDVEIREIIPPSFTSR